MKRITGLLSLIGLGGTVIAAGVVWPDLPKTGYVTGRPAAASDVKVGDAAAGRD